MIHQEVLLKEKLISFISSKLKNCSTKDIYKIEKRGYKLGENISKSMFDENLVLKK